MNPNIFYIADVFAEEKYAGNQLAVFRHVENLSDADMQRFAKEMNYSETTFILSEQERDGGYDVRIFTPENELPFAGHPTLGTAFILQQEVIGEPVDKVVLNLKVGQIPVQISYIDGKVDTLWMKQIEPQFGNTIAPDVTAPIVGLRTGDIDEAFPIQEVSTGVPTAIVPLKTLEALQSATIDRQKYFDLVEKIEAKGILIFCPETRHEANDLSVRFFADYYGVPEDPATGSANGCLAGYLVKHRYFGGLAIDIRVEQGYEIGRPSLLYLKSEDKEGQIDVRVGGRAVLIAKGEFV